MTHKASGGDLPSKEVAQQNEPVKTLFSANFTRTFSQTPWEKTVGYCRALRAGGYVHISGTAPVDSTGATVAPGNARLQTRKCLEIIESALLDHGASLAQVVRTRMFVTDITRWKEYGEAHGEYFRAHPPTTSMIEVKCLIDPEMLIEIEADAYVGSAD
jgi:isochorismate pyruvate lyase